MRASSGRDVVAVEIHCRRRTVKSWLPALASRLGTRRQETRFGQQESQLSVPFRAVAEDRKKERKKRASHVRRDGVYRGESSGIMYKQSKLQRNAKVGTKLSIKPGSGRQVLPGMR